ncbi:MAG: hypothetical protein ACRDTU_03380 [Micromonosporaceae bacterium]
MALIGIDLARLASATERELKRPLDDLPVGAVGGIDVNFQSSIGAGLVLAVIACLLLGAAAGLSTAGVRRPAPAPVFIPPTGVPVPTGMPVPPVVPVSPGVAPGPAQPPPATGEATAVAGRYPDGGARYGG